LAWQLKLLVIFILFPRYNRNHLTNRRKVTRRILTLSPHNKLSSAKLFYFNIQSTSTSLKVVENVICVSNSSVSHPDPSCLHMGLWSRSAELRLSSFVCSKCLVVIYIFSLIFWHNVGFIANIKTRIICECLKSLGINAQCLSFALRSYDFIYNDTRANPKLMNIALIINFTIFCNTFTYTCIYIFM